MVLRALDARVLNELLGTAPQALDRSARDYDLAAVQRRPAVRVLHRLCDEPLGELAASVLNRLSRSSELQQLDAKVLNALSDETLSMLGEKILNALQNNQINLLDARVPNGLSNDALTSLDARVLNELSNNSKKNLSIWPLLSLSDDGFSKLNDSVFGNIELNKNSLNSRKGRAGGDNELFENNAGYS